MTKRKALPQITPPDPDQIMMAGVAPVSIGGGGGVAGWPIRRCSPPPKAAARHRLLESHARSVGDILNF